VTRQGIEAHAYDLIGEIEEGGLEASTTPYETAYRRIVPYQANGFLVDHIRIAGVMVFFGAIQRECG